MKISMPVAAVLLLATLPVLAQSGRSTKSAPGAPIAPGTFSQKSMKWSQGITLSAATKANMGDTVMVRCPWTATFSIPTSVAKPAMKGRISWESGPQSATLKDVSGLIPPGSYGPQKPAQGEFSTPWKANRVGQNTFTCQVTPASQADEAMWAIGLGNLEDARETRTIFVDSTTAAVCPQILALSVTVDTANLPQSPTGPTQLVPAKTLSGRVAWTIAGGQVRCRYGLGLPEQARPEIVIPCPNAQLITTPKGFEPARFHCGQ